MIKEFRVASIEDLPQIINIYNDAISDGISTADSDKVSIESKVDWFLSHDKDNRPILVKEYKKKIIAWLNFQPFYSDFAYINSARVNIYIDRNFRGQKLGQKFLKEAIEKAEGYRIKTLLAFIFSDNIASLKLFKKMNFKDWGHFPKIAQIHNKDKDLIILGLTIEKF